MRNLRVWFGPLPLAICQIQGYFTFILVFNFCLLIVFTITLLKFMFICVWKRMREMNDDLIARIIVIWAIFISIWFSTLKMVLEGPIGVESMHLCTGKS